MPRPPHLAWISTAILIGVLQGALATEASAQPTTTRELDSPIRGERWAQHFTVHFVANDYVGNRTITPAIPEGKKLVLQSVSLHTVMTHGQNLMQATVALNPGRNPLAYFYVDMDFQASEIGGAVSARDRHFTGNRDINMVLNAGDSIWVGFFRNGFQGQVRANYNRVTFIGYFVDVDPLTPPSE